MSSRAKRMSQNCAHAEFKPGPTKIVTVRITFMLHSSNGEQIERSAFMELAGIPAELPKEIQEPLIKGAERQFIMALNQRNFLETYTTEGKPGEEHPIFVNLSQLDAVKILGTTVEGEKPEVGTPTAE